MRARGTRARDALARSSVPRRAESNNGRETEAASRDRGGKFAKGKPISTEGSTKPEDSGKDVTEEEREPGLGVQKGKSPSPRERGFIRAYVAGETQGRALPSARAAGFGAEDTGIGRKLLRRPHVKAEIARLLAKQVGRDGLPEQTDLPRVVDIVLRE
jgi:hypothetical protein